SKIKRNNKLINLVKREELLLDFKENRTSLSVLNPLTVFTLLLVIVLFITYKDIKSNKRTKYLDFIVFFITGIIGLLLTYLWLFSSHKTAPNNFNVLWSFSPNLIISFLLLKVVTKKWIQKYIKILLVLLLILPILWLLGIQMFPTAVIPLLVLLFVRYLFLYRYLLTFVK
ncbi:MAG: hypothetical protein ACI9JT_000748, partial [Polaribacter sp.]